MKWLAILVVCACETAAPRRTDPQPPPPPPEPVKPVVQCLDATEHREDTTAVELQYVYGKWFHVCYVSPTNDDKEIRHCVGIDETGKAIAVPTDKPDRLSYQQPRGTYELKGGKPYACISGTCTPLGAKAAAAMLALDPSHKIAVTYNAKLVMGGYDVWNVQSDRKLAFMPPPRAMRGGYPDPIEFSPIGENVIAVWRPCAGPCSITRVFTPDGTFAGTEFETEHGPTMLDDNTFALPSPTHVAIYDVASGVQQRVIEWAVETEPHEYTAGGVVYRWDFADNMGPLTLMPLGRNRAVITAAPEPVLTIIDYVKGTIEKRIRIPICGDPDAQRDAAHRAKPP